MIQKITKKLIIVALLLGVATGFTLVPSGVYATPKDTISSGVKDIGGSDEGNTSADFTKTIKNVVNILLFLIGVTAVIFIVIAGFRFVTANGDSNSVTSARNTILYAVVGLVVAVSAYAMVNFVIGQL